MRAPEMSVSMAYLQSVWWIIQTTMAAVLRGALNRLGNSRCGPTPVLAFLFAPVPAYVLWMHFLNYSGSRLILLIPVGIAVLTGFVERRRNPMEAGIWLVGATYGVIAADTVAAALSSDLAWGIVPALLFNAATWTAVTIGLPTLLLTTAGFLLRLWISRRFSRHFQKANQTAPIKHTPDNT